MIDITAGKPSQSEFVKSLKDAHNRANERNQANRRRRRPQPRQGAVNLSNTDSLSRANRVRRQIRAKISEILQSDLEPEVRQALVRTAQVQLGRVDNKIRQIRRRERAQEEEKRDNRAERNQEEDRRAERLREERRRRRRHDLQPRSIRVQRGWLYSARDGGFCPYRMAGNQGSSGFKIGDDAIGAGPAVSFDVAGATGFVDMGGSIAADIVNVML